MLGRRRPAAAVAAIVIAVGALSGCGSDDAGKDKKKDADAGPSATTSAPAPYLDVPEGVTLTAPGTSLSLGEEATVAFERRQGEIDVLAVAIDRIERTSFRESFSGWNLSDEAAARTPYFVRLTVTNADDTDLGGRGLDGVLWVDDGTTLEAPNSYPSTSLPACSGKALPKTFAPGDAVDLCQVYFVAPSRSLESVLFQPYGGLEPITWSGKASLVSDPSKKQEKKTSKKSGKKPGAAKGEQKKSGSKASR